MSANLTSGSQGRMAHGRKRIFIIATVAMFGLGGCQTTKEDIGTAFGAVIGAGLGALIGGNAIGALIGGSAGMIAGNIIGSELDREDRLKAEAATNMALTAEGPTQVSWRSDKNKGTYGQVSTTKPALDAFAYKCRTVEQLFYKSGERHESSGRYCLIDGKWKRA